MNTKNRINGKIISIIIPVYNTEEYLRQCLTSVIKQEYGNIEVVVIDDGSTDGSGAICDEFSDMDDRVKVIHTVNNGVSSARNLGLKSTTGEYVVFIDSDDWVDPGYIMGLYIAVEKSAADFVISGRSIYQNGHIGKIMRIEDFLPDISESKDIRSALIMHFMGRYNLGSNAAKIYKRNIILNRAITFNESLHINEDIVFNIEYLFNINKAFVLDSAGYYYRKREGSATASYDENFGNRINLVAAEKRRLALKFKFMNVECRTAVNHWFIRELFCYYFRTLRDDSYTDFRKRFKRTTKLINLLNSSLEEDSNRFYGLTGRFRAFVFFMNNFKCINRLFTYGYHIKSMHGEHK